MEFVNWEVKNKVQRIFWGARGLSVGGSEIFCFPDLSCITLRKWRSLKFLVTALQQHHIAYQWDFPFNIIIAYSGQCTVVRIKQEEDNFLGKNWGHLGETV